ASGNILGTFSVFARVGGPTGRHPAYNAAPNAGYPIETEFWTPKEGPVEDEELEEESAEDEEFPEELADGDDEEEPAAAAPTATEPPEEGEASLDELLTTRAEEAGGEEDDEDSVLSLDRDERIETLSVKVVPQQPTEFTCR